MAFSVKLLQKLTSDSPLLLLRYTPYFFDKNILDNILEESVDQHFHTLIQNRALQRRREIVGDSSDGLEDNADNTWEPEEVICWFRTLSNCLLEWITTPSVPLIVSTVESQSILRTKILLHVYLSFQES